MKIYERAAETFPVIFTKVETIPETASGKPQLILNQVAKKLTDFI